MIDNDKEVYVYFNYDRMDDRMAYNLDCICGKELETSEGIITCPVCKRRWAINLVLTATDISNNIH